MNKVIVGLVVLVGVGLGAYLFSVNRNKEGGPVSPSSPTVTPSQPEMSPSETAQGFYAQYEDCMKNPPRQAAGQVSLYCQSHNPFISSTFVINLERGGIAQAGADPVVCAQDFPTSFSVGTITVEGGQAQGEIIESFGEQFKVKTTISLLKENTGWKVDNITCPRP